MTAWIEVQIETAAEVAELVATAVAPLTGGVELRDAETVFPTSPDRAAVIALVPPDQLADLLAEVEGTLAVAREAGTPVDPVTIRQRDAHEDEWRDVWKQFFRATRVGQRFVVRPSWDPGEAPPGEHVIDLDPGRAFGTGAHPSTRLVIGLAEKLQAASPAGVRRFLDLGCGSGILSIVAAWLWPQARGLAVDVDVESTECARENLDRNRVTSVDVRAGELAAITDRFELIMANIQADVLEMLAPALPARLTAGGTLLLSGLLATQVEAVAAVYQAAGFRVDERADEGEWGALRLSLPA